MAQNLHRTARGKVIDMHKLMNQNELEVAVSNARINARGDLLGPGGTIIRNTDPINDIPNSGIVAHHQPSVQPAAKPAAPLATVVPAAKPAAPVFETPNALVQPVLETKEVDNKPNYTKGKQ